MIYSQKGLVELIISKNEEAVKSFQEALTCFSSSRKKDILERYPKCLNQPNKSGNRLPKNGPF